jgi:hypothetical protein
MPDDRRRTHYELGARVKPLSRDEEFITPYQELGYHLSLADANIACRWLMTVAPGLEVRIVQCE